MFYSNHKGLPEDTLGKRIYKQRMINGLGTVELAKMLGVSKVAVQWWENGIGNPRKKNMDKLCEVFGVESL